MKNVLSLTKLAEDFIGSNPRPATSHLLLILQESGQLLRCQVILPVTVRHHQQEKVPSQRHHLVEDGELLVCQRALLIVRVCFLRD